MATPPRPCKRHRSRHDGVTINAVIGGNGHALDCGHFIAEERPTELLEALRPFLRRAGSAS